MPSPLTIPGVQVRTEFEPAPVLPGATGVLGVVGVTDRGPVAPTPVGSVAELVDQFGPATRYTMPEVRTAFANGVYQAWISRIAPGRGRKASVTVNDREGEPVVTFVARAEGAWGNQLAVRVTPVATLSGTGVKYVDVAVLFRGEEVEHIDNLVMDVDSPNDLFERINAESSLVVAVDPTFDTQLPRSIARTALSDDDARAAFATLKSGAVDAVRVEAKRAGRAGNQFAVQVQEGRAGRTFNDSNDAPSVEIAAVEPGPDGNDIRITVQASGPDSVTVVVIPPGAAPRTIGPVRSVDELVRKLADDPSVRASSLGSTLPAAQNQAKLLRRVDVTVFAEGKDARVYPNIATVAAMEAISDPGVAFHGVGDNPRLPNADDGTVLTGGRNRGAALALGADADAEPLVELVPASEPAPAIEVEVVQGTSALDGATPVANVSIFADGELAESFPDTTMDPDDQRYLPAVLASSTLVRAHDLFVRSRTTSLPTGTPRPFVLTGGIAPTVDDYQEGLDRLETAEDVDLVIASVANEFVGVDDQVRAVHQAVAAHCTKMADVARNRIGLGSATDNETADPKAVLDHADDVRSDHFVLVAPARMEAALAGLLGRQDYFQSPTFKTIASPDATPGSYTDSQLEQLIKGNVTVVNERRRIGIIVVKGLLTSGMQINVRRTANKAVRDVKATADRYIGLLNNDANRNALLQQITALLLQMERDGALVPSTDGKDPAFLVDVYSSENDFALGIVRIDIAVRPVRAIDYVYATIFVKN